MTSSIPFFMTILPLICMLFSAAISIGVYVLSSFGLYSMANNTGMRNPWLAWIPLCNSFVLGSLADRYNEHNYNKSSKYRIILVAAQVAIYPVVYICMFSLVISMSMAIEYGNESSIIGSALFTLFIILAICAAVVVIQLICYYKIFMDFEPSSAVGYTVAAFFGFGFIPMFICRNNVPVGIAGVCSPRQPHYDTNKAYGGENSTGYRSL